MCCLYPCVGAEERRAVGEVVFQKEGGSGMPMLPPGPVVGTGCQG